MISYKVFSSSSVKVYDEEDVSLCSSPGNEITYPDIIPLGFLGASHKTLKDSSVVLSGSCLKFVGALAAIQNY